MQINLFEVLTYFIIYSFLGWVMESVVRTVAEKKLINTGFLVGPFCPIYGFGACIMFLFLEKLKNDVILLFLVSMIVLSIWEYIVGFFLEKIFNTKYWDYSKRKFNLQGRVCLANSICWGIIGVLFVHFIHPFIQSLIAMVNVKILYFIIGVLTVVLFVDAIISTIKVKNIKGKLEYIEKLNAEIKEKLKEIKQYSKEREKEAKNKNIQVLVEELKNKRNKTILKLYKNVNRLKKAFPAVNTKEIAEVLSKKMEIKKNNKNT